MKIRVIQMVHGVFEAWSHDAPLCRYFQALQDEQANAALEFAVSFWLLLLVFLGCIDYARFLYADIAIRDAAKVGLETAMNPCAGQSDCLPGAQALSDSAVQWAVYCEGQPYLQLSPGYTYCPAHGYGSPPCAASCTTCVQDVCVQHPGTDDGQATVRVAVGYRFRPLSFMFSPFFGARSCFAGDSTSVNNHNLCVAYTGRVGSGP
jgi:hypothetical protein